MIQFVAILFLLAGCSGSEDHNGGGHQESMADSQQHGSHTRTGHHGDHSHANDYMNQSKFEELVGRFESEDRLQWQKPDVVVDKMGLEGKVVADLGAGTGYFSVRLAASASRVIAIDIDERFLNYIEGRKAQLDPEVAGRISTRLAEENDSRLEDGEVDKILTVNTYHHFNDRVNYFSQLKNALKDGGSLWVIDFKPGDLPYGPPSEMKIDPDQIETELKEAGYSAVSVDSETLPHQFILIAKK